MRQLGKLPTESDAQRLAAWLVTQRIEAHAEPDEGGWAVWVRDEDHLDEARAALEHFRAHPQDERYRIAPGAAERMRREEEQQRAKAAGNVVEMRGRWASGAGGAARRCPLVLAMIGASILVSLAARTLWEGNPNLAVLFSLLFVDPVAAIAQGELDMWASLRHGEIWRLISPIFIHYDILHLLFNMFWLFDLGGQIENRRGTWRMLLLVFVLAVLSNIGQALEADLRGIRLDFGGMSGVVYGLFGYVLVKLKFGNRELYQLSQANIVIMMVWFFLCLARQFVGGVGLLSFIPPIANSAHTVGLFAGMAIAYAPIAIRGKAS